MGGSGDRSRAPREQEPARTRIAIDAAADQVPGSGIALPFVNEHWRLRSVQPIGVGGEKLALGGVVECECGPRPALRRAGLADALGTFVGALPATLVAHCGAPQLPAP
jgi:hypothetical protein